MRRLASFLLFVGMCCSAAEGSATFPALKTQNLCSFIAPNFPPFMASSGLPRWGCCPGSRADMGARIISGGSGSRRGYALTIMASVKKDYYKVLGVDRKADTKEIRRVYKRLAMKNHPDVSKDPNAKEKFIEINEAYAVLSDPDKRRKYDLGNANPFSGWSGSSTRSSSSTRGSSSAWSTTPGGGVGFDFDEYWKQYRGKDESLKDIDDSFSSIFSDLFSGAKKAAGSVRSKRGRGKDSLLNDFGDFLETMLGVDDLKSEGSEDLEDFAGDEDAMRVEISDAEFVVEQLVQRARRLQEDAARTEVMAEEWGRKVKVATGEEREQIEAKRKILDKSAKRLRERAQQVEKMVKSQKERVQRVRDMLAKAKDRKRGGSSSTASSYGGTTSRTSTSSSSSSAAEKVIVSCYSCGQKVRVPGGVSGTVNCPACGVKFETDGMGKSQPAGSKSESAGAREQEREKVVVGCPTCGQKLRVTAGKAGSISCPSCKGGFEVDAASRVTGKTTPQSSSGSSSSSRDFDRGARGRSSPDYSVTDGDKWAETIKMREELRKAKVEDDLSDLKKQMGL